jgi:hypothetical protein
MKFFDGMHPECSSQPRLSLHPLEYIENCNVERPVDPVYPENRELGGPFNVA